MKRKLSLPSFSRICIAIDFDVFRGPRNIALAGADPVADHAGAEHVARPTRSARHPKRKAWGTNCRGGRFRCTSARDQPATSISSCKTPVGQSMRTTSACVRLSEADDQVGRILSEIAGRSGDFEFLAIAAGEDFDLGSDGALVVVQPFQIQAAASDFCCRLHCAAARRDRDSG